VSRRIVHLALGSNLPSVAGDRMATLVEAVRRLEGDAMGLRTVQRSTVYETPPVPAGQPAYLNAAIAVETALSLPDILTIAQAVERSLGRERSAGERWGPRTIDIDILLDGESVFRAGGPLAGSGSGSGFGFGFGFGFGESDGLSLTVPHPRLAERLFVLVPLAEIAPEALVPPAGTPVQHLLARATASAGEAARQAVRPIGPLVG
jgi:2-amino-4-hydroxy-6-hydroxymethyldihydropteridine diphosphokinase